jgi:hypothetical protein
MRLWNEGATIILCRSVLVVLKTPSIGFTELSDIPFLIIIMLGFKFYKRIRERIVKVKWFPHKTDY